MANNDPTSDSSRLPFEPKKSRKKVEKQAANAVKASGTPPVQKSEAQKSEAPKTRQTRASREQARIPDAVSKRMIWRVVIFCGVPTSLSLATFFISYFLDAKVGIEVSNSVVFGVSLSLFIVGALGITYGLLSASWDEDIPGSLLGFQEFRLNFGRFMEGVKSSRQSQ
jgi:hypothetical protein